MRCALAITLAFSALPALASSPAPPGPLTLDQVLALVQAGVGADLLLRQAEPSGIAFTLGVEEVLALKRAGAGDDLIGRLMDLAPSPAVTRPAPSEAPPGPTPGQSAGEEPPFRIYSDVDGEGRKVLHITNLDSSGRRMGGDPAGEEPPRGNAYQSRAQGPSAVSEPEEPWERGYDEDLVAGGGGPAPPAVIVNIFNPAAEAAALAESPPEIYRARYVSGYLPWQPCLHAGHGGRHYRTGLASPPGSWTHYQLYHAEGAPDHAGLYHGGLAWRTGHPAGWVPRGRALPVPFHTSGAETLNRMRANVRLGH